MKWLTRDPIGLLYAVATLAAWFLVVFLWAHGVTR